MTAAPPSFYAVSYQRPEPDDGALAPPASMSASVRFTSARSEPRRKLTLAPTNHDS